MGVILSVGLREGILFFKIKCDIVFWIELFGDNLYFVYLKMFLDFYL